MVAKIIIYSLNLLTDFQTFEFNYLLTTPLGYLIKKFKLNMPK